MLTSNSLSELPVFRINPNDSNKFAVLFDNISEKLPFISVIEIFDKGGCTPPNLHKTAYEMFFVLQGKGFVKSGDDAVSFSTGMSFVVPPGRWHEVTNVSDSRLYTLTIMVPDEEFLALIRSGVADTLDAEDIRVITRSTANGVF
ncbi:cupin domain-containing protein [Acidithiobacillus ferrianus]|uniref:cupin domain-containing protein n=1 Tax=Acidithiobacillus ferrianus TaxID=2678518 RepID=UPI0034E4832A